MHLRARLHPVLWSTFLSTWFNIFWELNFLCVYHKIIPKLGQSQNSSLGVIRHIRWSAGFVLSLELSRPGRPPDPPHGGPTASPSPISLGIFPDAWVLISSLIVRDQMFQQLPQERYMGGVIYLRPWMPENGSQFHILPKSQLWNHLPSILKVLPHSWPFSFCCSEVWVHSNFQSLPPFK